MKKIVAAAVMTLWFMPTGALANPVGNERVGGAALGAVAGALVLGPVGAVVGAAVGFAEHRHGFDAEFFTGADHSQGDFTAVGYEDPLEHGEELGGKSDRGVSSRTG